MANTDAPAAPQDQPPPPPAGRGRFAELQQWLKDSDTLEKRHYGLIGCPNFPKDCGVHSVI